MKVVGRKPQLRINGIDVGNLTEAIFSDMCLQCYVSDSMEATRCSRKANHTGPCSWEKK